MLKNKKREIKIYDQIKWNNDTIVLFCFIAAKFNKT